MKTIYFYVDGNNYINGGMSNSPMRGAISLVVPDDHEILNDDPMVYKYGNGELIKDEVYQQQLIAEAKEEAEKPSKDDMNAIAIMELAEMIMTGVK